MPDHAFKAALVLTMCADPSPLDNDLEWTNYLDGEARRRGFENWVVAYHEFEVSA